MDVALLLAIFTFGLDMRRGVAVGLGWARLPPALMAVSARFMTSASGSREVILPYKTPKSSAITIR